MKFFPPTKIDGETVKPRRFGPNSGPTPGTERWELRDEDGTGMICHLALPNDTSDQDGLARLGVGS